MKYGKQKSYVYAASQKETKEKTYTPTEIDERNVLFLVDILTLKYYKLVF